jgi:hypothetical protein
MNTIKSWFWKLYSNQGPIWIVMPFSENVFLFAAFVFLWSAYCGLYIWPTIDAIFSEQD